MDANRMNGWLTRWLLAILVAAACWLALAPAAAQTGIRYRRRVIAFENPTSAVAAADFNGDGRVDVASTSAEDVSWYERGAVSSFWRKQPVQVRMTETGALASDVLLAADVDLDVDVDLVSVGSETGQIAWYENAGTAGTPQAGKVWRRHLVDVLKGARWAALEDLNRDGRPELVANSENAIVWYAIPGNPRGMLPASYTGDPAGRPIWERKHLARSGATGKTHALVFGDVDGDGDRDLSTGASGGGYFAWWERPADGTLLWSKRLVQDNVPGATFMAPGDLDGSGGPDLLLVRGLAQGISWRAGPDFKTDQSIETGWLAHPGAAVLADLDRDGDLDFAAGSPDGNRLAWWVNDGKGRFTRSEIDLEQSAADIRPTDLDGDGDLDLAVAGGSSRNVVWYENLRL